MTDGQSYVRFSTRQVARTVQVTHSILVDLDHDDNLIGIELLNDPRSREVIELPEPDCVLPATEDENGYVEWNYPHGHVAVTDDGTIMWGQWHFDDAGKLRQAVACLLAAAAKAEGQQ